MSRRHGEYWKDWANRVLKEYKKPVTEEELQMIVRRAKEKAMLNGCKFYGEQGKIAPMKSERALDKQVGGGHYKTMPIQPIEYAHVNGFGPCETLALRYISRHRTKNGRQDIEKAIHVLELLLDLEYPE